MKSQALSLRSGLIVITFCRHIKRHSVFLAGQPIRDRPET
jgi:hypothetical protein